MNAPAGSKLCSGTGTGTEPCRCESPIRDAYKLTLERSQNIVNKLGVYRFWKNLGNIYGCEPYESPHVHSVHIVAEKQEINTDTLVE